MNWGTDNDIIKIETVIKSLVKKIFNVNSEHTTLISNLSHFKISI